MLGGSSQHVDSNIVSSFPEISLVSFNPDFLVMVYACPSYHQTGDTDSFQLAIPLTVQLDSQGTFVPCEARIVWYSAGRISSRQLRDTTESRTLRGRETVLGFHAETEVMRMLTDYEVRLWNRTKDGEPYARKRARTVREGGCDMKSS
jgi:hypothetical protein